MDQDQVTRALAQVAQNLDRTVQQYTNTGNTSLLEMASSAWRSADVQDNLKHVLPEVQAALFNNAGLVLYHLYLARGEIVDLEEAVSLFRLALELVSDTRARQASVLNNLSAALQVHYIYSADPADLDQAIDASKHALELAPEGSPEHPRYWVNLTGAQYERYQHSSRLEDLDGALHSAQAALEATPPDSPLRPIRLNNLAVLHQERYSRLGNLEDLNQAVAVYSQVLLLIPETHPERAAYLNNLGGCINDLFRRNGKMQDLLEAVEALRQATKIAPPTAPHRAGFLNNLGNTLVSYYQRTGDLSALEEAVTAQRQAVLLANSGSTYRVSFLTSLGSSLSEWFVHSGDLSVIDEAISVCEQALNQTPQTSTKRASRLNNLARCLRDRYKTTANPEDLTRGRLYYKEACEQGQILQTEIVLVAGYNWGLWALQRRDWAEAAEALDYALEAADHLFKRQVLRSSKESWLREAQVLPALAAYAEARSGNLEQSLQILENGRTKLLGQTLAIEQYNFSQLIQIGHADLHHRLRSAIEGVAALEQSELQGTIEEATSHLEKMRVTRHELELAIADIQRITGFEDFMRPSLSTEIQKTFHLLNRIGVYWAVTPVGSLALIVGDGSVQVVWLGITSDELDHLLLGTQEDPLKGYLAATLGFKPIPYALEVILPIIGEKLVYPIVNYLASHVRQSANSDQSIILIPTGLISVLPLHAATYSMEGKTRCLIDYWKVTYIPSARFLHYAYQSLNALPPQMPSWMGVASPEDLPDNWPNLPFTLFETNVIASLFEGTADLFTGQSANLQTVTSHLQKVQMIHLACHGVFEPEQPLNSGVVLNQNERLSLAILFSYHLSNNRLVVLSVCQSAVADFSRLPEEMLGLPTGFLQAGTPGVVASLWPIDDQATSLLMIKFYELLLTEIPHKKPDRALRQAQNWLREVTNAELSEKFDHYRHILQDSQFQQLVSEQFRQFTLAVPEAKPYQDPYYWAGFVFYGI